MLLGLIDGSDPFAFALGGWLAWRVYSARNPKPPKHEHEWVVIEKEKLVTKGVTVEDVERVKRAADYAVNFSTLMSRVRPGGEELAVHYRCYCGAEKVERV